MPDLTITWIPADLLDRLRRSADFHRRTLDAEVLMRLTRSVSTMPADRDELLQRSLRRRDRMSVASRGNAGIDEVNGRDVPDTAPS